MNIVFQTHFNLGSERYVTVKVVNRSAWVHIRQFIKHRERIYPTTLGVYLSSDQFRNLLDLIMDINYNVHKFRDGKMESFKYHLGNNVYISSGEGCHASRIRIYFQYNPKKIIKPGIALRFSEWNKLVDLMVDIKNKVECNVEHC